MNKNILCGIGWGVVSTISMTIVHSLARVVGLFPASKPVYIVLASKIFGSGLPEHLILVLGLGCHLAYGGFWGGVLYAMTRRVTVWKGIGMGLFLWLIMQLVVFPFLGRGIFGSQLTWKMLPATLGTHLIYGATLGWLGARTIRSALATQPATGKA